MEGGYRREGKGFHALTDESGIAHGQDMFGLMAEKADIKGDPDASCTPF